ncbi:MAG TPA: hypothetical protein VGG06_34105 [Thermoanaerobaculia bacterium]
MLSAACCEHQNGRSVIRSQTCWRNHTIGWPERRSRASSRAESPKPGVSRSSSSPPGVSISVCFSATSVTWA